MENESDDEKGKDVGQQIGARFEGAAEVSSLEEFLERARKLGFSKEEIKKIRETYAREIKENW